jgi:hypothetical protein
VPCEKCMSGPIRSVMILNVARLATKSIIETQEKYHSSVR